MSKLTYEKAETELQEIVKAIEEGEIGIDQLQKHIKRAADLIRFCKEKLRTTEENIASVLSEE